MLCIYILFEHQTEADKWIRFRLCKYIVRIWDESFKKSPDQEALNPILSIVFYIGKNQWTYSQELIDLVHPKPLPSQYIPSFKHVLIDHSDKNKQIKGAIKAQIAQLLIQAHFYQHFNELINDLVAIGS